MEKVNRKIILIAVVFSIITSALIYIYLNKTISEADTQEYVDILVAARTINALEEIKNEDIISAKVIKEAANTNALNTREDIVGKLAESTIMEGEQVIAERLVEKERATLPYSIPEGMRIISINVVEQIAVSNLIRPGDYVDVVASFENEDIEINGLKQSYPRISKTIIQKVKVISLGQKRTVTGDTVEAFATVALEVKTADVEKLTYAAEYSSLRLVLRPAEDETMPATKGIQRSDLTTSK